MKTEISAERLRLLEALYQKASARYAETRDLLMHISLAVHAIELFDAKAKEGE